MINQHATHLFSYWQHLVIQYTKDQQLIKNLFGQIEKAYQQENRFYHNLNHISRLMKLADQYAAFINDIKIVQFSIFYHDIEYIPGSKHNELKSAEIAKEALIQLNVNSGIINKVEKYILATKDHYAQKSINNDLMFFLDIDLSILGASREEYKNYLIQIRKEYGHLSAKEFSSGRLQFVNKLISQPNLFFTDSFKIYESMARQNLQWEREKGLQQFE